MINKNRRRGKPLHAIFTPKIIILIYVLLSITLTMSPYFIYDLCACVDAIDEVWTFDIYDK